MNRLEEIAATLRGRASDEQRLRRQILGAGMAVGFFVGLSGYAVTGNGWWFVAPFIGIAVGWRIAFGRWPFGRA